MTSAGLPNSNSASCKDFMQSAKDKFVTDQIERKSNAMQAARGAAQRVFDADRNSSIALIRSQNILNAGQFVNDYNTGIEKNLDHDNDITRRQFEINEYHYHNKLDTLFFLQLLFITVLVMAILIYFNRRGTLTTKMTGILTAVLAVILILVGVSRYFYTERTRDRRLWHRRYFQKEKAPPAEEESACASAPSGINISLNDFFKKEDIQCAEETNENLKKWFETQNTEAEQQMKGFGIPVGIFNTDLAVGKSCKKR